MCGVPDHDRYVSTTALALKTFSAYALAVARPVLGTLSRQTQLLNTAEKREPADSYKKMHNHEHNINL